MMKQLQRLAYEQKGRYYSFYGLSFMIGTLIILQAYFIVLIVDQIFLKKASFQVILAPLFGLLIILIARSVFSYWNGRTGVQMAAKVKRDYRKRLISAYSNHSLLTSYQGQAGKKVSMMMDAVDELDSFFSKYIPQKILTSVVPMIILIVIFSQHFYSGLIIILTAPFIPVFMIIIGKQTQRKAEEQLDRMTDFSGRFLDTLQGLISLKLFGRSKEQKDIIRRSSIDFRDSTMSLLKIAFTSSLMLEFISMLSIGLVALEIGLRLVVFDQINFFTAFFILLLVPEFFASLKELGAAFHVGRSSMGAATKVEEALKNEEQSNHWGSRKMSSSPPLIQLKNVGFRYRSDGFELSHINAEISPYHQTVIVGKSGSGKTTLLHILAGLLFPSEGEVRINGHILEDYIEHDWFRNVSYITQHPYLFSGTIEDNIALGMHNTVTPDDIKQAAMKAGIHKMIQTLPLGYNTYIGEGGRGVSGGEKQRIALARAFLKKPLIVLFDEPTTGLDLYTEQILQNSIRELSEISTVITVAHRVRTIKQANQIIFLEEGRLSAQGTHDELMESKIKYKDLFSKHEGEQP
jgi:ATP-binding cassette subfamily C protein CydD